MFSSFHRLASSQLTLFSSSSLTGSLNSANKSFPPNTDITNSRDEKPKVDYHCTSSKTSQVSSKLASSEKTKKYLYSEINKSENLAKQQGNLVNKYNFNYLYLTAYRKRNFFPKFRLKKSSFVVHGVR